MGVTLTSLVPRSKICTFSSSSSFLIATDSVGWLTKHASAARPKCRSRATATMYFNSVSVIGGGPIRAMILIGSSYTPIGAVRQPFLVFLTARIQLEEYKING